MYGLLHNEDEVHQKGERRGIAVNAKIRYVQDGFRGVSGNNTAEDAGAGSPAGDGRDRHDVTNEGIKSGFIRFFPECFDGIG